MSFELPPKKNFFTGQSQLTESNIQRILSEYIQPQATTSSSYMSRRTSHTYDITVNKENQQPDQTRVSDFSQRISNMQQIYQTAVSEYNQASEQGQMLIEDLNGQLLSRAELIAQREDMDLLLEQHMQQSNFEYEYALAWEDCNSRLASQHLKIKELSKQLDGLISRKAHLSNQLAKKHTEQVSLAYVDITNQIGRTQNKIAIEQKHVNQIMAQQDQMNLTLRRTILDNTKQAFQEYLHNQQTTFKKLKECYGLETYQQILTEHKQQLESLLTSQYTKKILQIQQMQQCYNRVQQLIHSNVTFVDSNLTIDIEAVKQTIELKRDVMQQLSRTLSQQTVPSNQVHQLKRKVELLELEKLQLEQQVIEMTLRMESQSKRYNQVSKQGFKTAEKIYGEILGSSPFQRSPIPKQGSSQKKSRSYSEINQNRQLYRTQKFMDRINDTSLQSDSMLLAQSFQSLTSNDLSNLRASDWLDKACQISADDSLLQHIYDLNSTIQSQQPQPLKESKKALNMPLQRKQLDSQPSQPDEDANVRLQTITEEQLSTNRQDEERRLNFKIHSHDLSNLLIEDHNNTTKKHQFLLTSQPTTNKAQRNGLMLSDQVFKSKKSRSVDYTSKYFSSTYKHTSAHEPPKPTLMPIEQDVLRTIQPLMHGTDVYKKFSTHTQLKKEEFNPSSNQSPHQLGYGQRVLMLSKKMDTLEFRNPMKPLVIDIEPPQVVESSIKIDQILRTLIPPAQNRRPKAYLQMSIVVQGQARVELLLTGDQWLLQWYHGIQFLKDNLKLIMTINKKLAKQH